MRVIAFLKIKNQLSYIYSNLFRTKGSLEDLFVKFLHTCNKCNDLTMKKKALDCTE